MLKSEEYIVSINSIIDKHYKNLNDYSRIELILYYYTLHKVYNKDENAERFESVLNDYLKLLSSHSSNIQSQADHFIYGLFILSEPENSSFVNSTTRSQIERIDHNLFNYAFAVLREKQTDNLQYITTIINYFTSKLPEGKYAEYLNQLLPLIFNCIEKYTDYNAAKNGTTQALYLGFGNGLAGLLLSLVNLHMVGIKNDQTEKVITKAIKYIFSLKREIDFSPGNYSMFPYRVNRHEKDIAYSSQLSWANSDLNHSILFYKSDQILHNHNLHRIAELIGLNTLIRKDIASTQVMNSCFFNGAAGVAESYRALYQLSKQTAYKEGYEYWIDKTMFYLDQEIKENKHLHPNFNFLKGLTGVGLTLLSHISQDELSWNKLLFA